MEYIWICYYDYFNLPLKSIHGFPFGNSFSIIFVVWLPTKLLRKFTGNEVWHLNFESHKKKKCKFCKKLHKQCSNVTKAHKHVFSRWICFYIWDQGWCNWYYCKRFLWYYTCFFEIYIVESGFRFYLIKMNNVIPIKTFWAYESDLGL